MNLFLRILNLDLISMRQVKPAPAIIGLSTDFLVIFMDLGWLSRKYYTLQLGDDLKKISAEACLVY